MMKKSISTIATLLTFVLYTCVTVGCGSSPTPTTPTAAHDHDHDDHEGHDHDEHEGHDDHEGHDHPEHGPNGGHMVELGGGAHAEWSHDDDKELVTVFPENAAKVTSVEMKTTIQGKTTVYPFVKADDAGMTIYTLTSPELLTSIKMGDAVSTELVITTADGESTGKVAHHAH